MTRKPARRCSIRFGCSSSPWMKPYIGISSSWRGSEWSRATSKTGRLSLALMLKISVWTEDRDFFGTGIATWTTDRVELYLQGRHG